MSMDTDANCTARIPPSKVQMNDLWGVFVPNIFSSCSLTYLYSKNVISHLIRTQRSAEVRTPTTFYHRFFFPSRAARRPV